MMLFTPRGGPARLLYEANGFRILQNGDHVLCAVTGVPIPLDGLRYWSVTRQEAYASAQISVDAALRLGGGAAR